jgi:WD40 repeat protein
VDLSTDHEHCSDCDRSCGSNESCIDYDCVCSGALFPCFSGNSQLLATDIFSIAGYRDATHDWVAYSDSAGNAGATIVVHDNATGLSVRSILVPHWDVQLVFLSNQPTLLYSSNGTLSRVAEEEEPAELLRGITWFKVSPDGQTLATLSSANAMVLTLRSYPELAVQEELSVSIPIGEQQERLAFSRDGRWLAATGLSGNTQVQLFDRSNGSSRVMSAVGATGTYSPVFSEDGRELFVGGGYADGRVYVFDTATGAELRRLTPFENYVYTVAQVPGFRQLLVAGYGGRIAVVDAVSGDILWQEQFSDDINRAIFSPDGRRLYAGGRGLLYTYAVN